MGKREMFGKLLSGSNIHKAKRWFGKAMSDVSNASQWVHKGVKSLRDGYKHGKRVIRSIAHDVGGDGALAMANEVIADVGMVGAPVGEALGRADRYSKVIHKAAHGLQNNAHVKNFVNT